MRTIFYSLLLALTFVFQNIQASSADTFKSIVKKYGFSENDDFLWCDFELSKEFKFQEDCFVAKEFMDGKGSMIFIKATPKEGTYTTPEGMLVKEVEVICALKNKETPGEVVAYFFLMFEYEKLEEGKIKQAHYKRMESRVLLPLHSVINTQENPNFIGYSEEPHHGTFQFKFRRILIE